MLTRTKESQRRLERLKAMLDKKIHRKDISVMQDELPPKTEFVLTVPLTSLQQKLYEGALAQTRKIGPNHNGLFEWINILRLICNHPATLSVFPHTD
jgi:SNF2 family DNA or RNA helicase